MLGTAEFVTVAVGSVISRNALDRRAPIRWAFREQPQSQSDNGWRFLSEIDDEAYLADPENLTMVDFNSVVDLEPALLALLHLDVGTDVTIERAHGGKITLIDNSTGRPLTFP